MRCVKDIDVDVSLGLGPATPGKLVHAGVRLPLVHLAFVLMDKLTKELLVGLLIAVMSHAARLHNLMDAVLGRFVLFVVGVRMSHVSRPSP
jgi:ABC-type uncharacterized transport system permease subunit